ncbi:hypothetical protein GQ42DRAFT_87717 [Ramicandelaber brevisporus]|nr:hypothetical protein GQ42DRAFT_87717 [Ramicandelaber brevisporus]
MKILLVSLGLFGGAALAGTVVCNGRVCMDVNRNGASVSSVTTYTTPGGDYFGHYYISSSEDSFMVNTITDNMSFSNRIETQVGQSFGNGVLLCTEGYEHVEGGLILRGRPCIRF